MHIRYKLRQLTNVVLGKLNIPKIPPRIPLYFIEVTNQCNLNCDFCPRNDLSRGTGFMDFDLFKLIIERIKKMGAKYVNLNRFGESLTHPRFTEMLGYAKDQGIPNLGFVTNGQLLNPELVQTIVEAGVDRINVSLDTLDKARYEKTRKGARLEKTVNNLDYLIDYKMKKGSASPIIALFSVLVTDEFEQMQSIFKRYVNGVNYIEFRPIANYGSSQRLENLPSLKADKSNFLTCIQPWQRLNIFYNGDVNPCCGDIDGELVLGNIKDLSIKQLWYGKKINRIRKMMTNRVIAELPVCMGCDGCSKEWHDQALSQLKEVYHKLDPDIHVSGLSASTPILFRHSTGQIWK